MENDTDGATAELQRLAAEISVLLARLQTEYTRYLTGAEKKAPVVLRTKLDQTAQRARTLVRQCQNRALIFKAQEVLNKVQLYSVAWDKKLAALEKTSSKK